MLISATTLALLSLLGLSAATPVELAPRCGQTLFPFLTQQLTEANPATVNPNTLVTGDGDCHIAKQMDTVTGQVSKRISQIIAFNNIPPGSYNCQLNVAFPASYHIIYPNNWSWSTFYPRASPPFGQGVFGSITLASGQNAVINSEACPPNGGDLAFVFEIADWVWGSASVEFSEYVNKLNGAGLRGMYLTLDC